jgi:hypothetical protein
MQRPKLQQATQACGDVASLSPRALLPSARTSPQLCLERNVIVYNIGVATALKERGKWPEGKLHFVCMVGGKRRCPPGATDCCASTLLANQPDFKEQECAVQMAVRAYNEEHGTHHVVDFFLPKFHPECALRACCLATVHCCLFAFPGS